MFCFLDVLTYKGVYICAWNSTFRAAKMISPLSWPSRAGVSLPLTDAFLYKGHQLSNNTLNPSTLSRLVKLFAIDIYLSSITPTILCGTIFGGKAHCSLRKWPYPHLCRWRNFPTPLTTQGKELNTRAGQSWDKSKISLNEWNRHCL